MDQAVIKPERRLPALAVSRGIGIGRVVFLHGERRHFFRIDLDRSQVELELKRFSSAVDESIKQLRKLTVDTAPDPNQSVSDIFGVHLLIVEESSLIDKISAVIRDQKVNAEWALKMVSDQYLEKQILTADQHFREKHLDIEDVAQRVLAALGGSPSTAQLMYSGAVVVARELRPSAIMEMTKFKPAALITERGGWTSHTSILAREFKLPMASGIRNLDQTLAHGDTVVVDGINGQIILNPNLETIKQFHVLGTANIVCDDSQAENGRSTKTLDGTVIAIRANVDIPDAYQIAKNFGAEGIGLFRSESLIGQRASIPSEDEQILAYRRLAELTGDGGLKIRTFDIGIGHFNETGFLGERNPALGLRSIRLSLSDSGHFRTQIRAILRAAVGQKIDIVLPMISGVSEVLRSKAIIDEERAKLRHDGISFGDPKLGAMIEVPSAVLTANEIAQKVDFICLGTNDLVQYLLAVDRDNDSVADWYQTLHPAVIRAISQVLEAAKLAGIPFTVCGEMAGSAFYLPLLIGLGVRDLSMNVNSIRHIRHLLSGIDVSETTSLVNLVKECETAEETENLLQDHYLNNWSGLFPSGLLNSKHR